MGWDLDRGRHLGTKSRGFGAEILKLWLFSFSPYSSQDSYVLSQLTALPLNLGGHLGLALGSAVSFS